MNAITYLKVIPQIVKKLSYNLQTILLIKGNRLKTALIAWRANAHSNSIIFNT